MKRSKRAKRGTPKSGTPRQSKRAASPAASGGTPTAAAVTQRVSAITAPHTAEPTMPRTLTLALTPLHRDLIYHCSGFFTRSECASWIRHMSTAGMARVDSAATHETAGRHHTRVTDVLPGAAEGVWRRVRGVLPAGLRERAVGCWENVRLYRYDVGDWFGRHVDESVDVGGGRWTGVTVLVYLSEVQGGETVFYDGGEVVAVRPSVGGLLLHGHGQRCLEHEARVVRAGVKFVLRTDVVYETDE